MWDCPDSQEVGLEAATLERVRNSSLVEWRGADNVTGLRAAPKLRIVWLLRVSRGRPRSGRGAFPRRRRSTGRTAGAWGSANAGMSSVLWVRTPHTGSLRVPEQGRSAQGEAGLSRG